MINIPIKLTDRQKKAVEWMAELNAKRLFGKYSPQDLARETERIGLSTEMTAKAVRDYEKMLMISSYQVA